MIGNNTNCKKVCATQETITKTEPDATAAGNETSDNPKNKYAAHIVPTPRVSINPIRSLNESFPFTEGSARPEVCGCSL
jgi:hypothetical protein